MVLQYFTHGFQYGSQVDHRMTADIFFSQKRHTQKKTCGQKENESQNYFFTISGRDICHGITNV